METEPRPPYNDRFGRVEISEEDEEIGGRISKLFCERLTRVPPWNIRGNVVTITNNREIIDGLDNEMISLELARTVAGFKMVEDFLPYYMGRGNELVSRNKGLFEITTQWGREELNHGLALARILVQTGYKTEKEILNEYNENLKRTWQLPFSTARQVVAHFAFSEHGTFRAYWALKTRAEKEGALRIARVLELIAKDEMYHCTGYTEATKIYYDEDPEGTLEDVLYVTSEFRMPAQNLHPDTRQWIRDLIEVGVLRKGLVIEQILRPTLRGFGFISEEEADKAVKLFGRKKA